jgi:hypothetical protein
VVAPGRDDDRVLVKNQTDQKQNGIYVVDSGTWTRAPDWDGSYDAKNGSLVYVTDGSTYADNLFACTTSDPITIGTTSVAFAIVSTGNPLTLPLPLAQGGTGQSTKDNAAAALGIVPLTGSAGSANAQTATAPSGYSAFATNDLFEYTPAATNNAAATLTVTPSGGAALSAKNVFAGGAALVGGELTSGMPVLLLYDGTRLNIIGRSLTLPSLTVSGATSLAATSVAALTASGTVTAQGLVDISGASAGQIKFPATQNASAGANTLDDYEEGTWTPSIGGTATYSFQVGRYTKIGNMVAIQMDLQITGRHRQHDGHNRIAFRTSAQCQFSRIELRIFSNQYHCSHGPHRSYRHHDRPSQHDGRASVSRVERHIRE